MCPRVAPNSAERRTLGTHERTELAWLDRGFLFVEAEVRCSVDGPCGGAMMALVADAEDIHGRMACSIVLDREDDIIMSALE